MAAAVSHAMRRFPTTPPDTSYSPYASFRGEPPGRVNGESALSRSMRYADPWLYGSVRAPGGFYLTPAFVLCACPDYINGTKKSTKKSPSTCKKCKGARIPLSPESTKYGTVRYYPSEVATTSTPPRSGTVRVTSSKRPSILPTIPTPGDPYDLVRKSRLSTSETPNIFRARSVSPDGERKSKKTKSKSIESYNLTVGRRSILECNINPYELVTKENHGFNSSSNGGGKENGITLLNGQRIRVRPSIADNFDDVQLRLSTPSSNKSPTKPNKIGIIGSNGLKSVGKTTSPVLKDKKIQLSETPKSRPKSESAIADNELNQKFKSILKKSSERTPSPTQDRPGGSQFYIPLPNSKKKVQFLVSDLGSSTEEIANDDREDVEVVNDDVFEEEVIDEKVHEEIVEKSTEANPPPKKPITLHRSFSDRIKKPEPKINFYDTTALRQLKQRKNLKIDFSDLERLDGINRKLKKLTIDNEDRATNDINTNKTIEINKDVNTAEAPVAEIETNSNKIILDEKLAIAKLDKCINDAAPAAPPRKRSVNKQSIRIEPIITESCNKTVVQITTPSPVHKIQIKNEFPEPTQLQTTAYIENQQRKTSILINGDDCYSTVNVNDDIPIYQSSVVVKDSLPVNFINNTVDNAYKKKQCSSIYITNNDYTKDDDSNNDELLLLRDPVEAVRRNLVPHVCGKTDVIRRPYEEDDLSSEYEQLTPGSDYTDHSNRSSVTEDELANRSKFYELLTDSGVIEVSEPEEHIYECIKVNDDPIYEDIEVPPPLPSNPPPSSILDDINLDKEFTTRSIFEGASKYDILSYLVDAKERGVVQEDGYHYLNEDNNLSSQLSDSSEDNSLIISSSLDKKGVEVERNDSGVGSETSKSSLHKYRVKQEVCALCEDCEATLEQSNYLLCRKCSKKRSERKEIITEIVETEEKYSKDLQIILEEFYQPMLVAGLLTPEQLSAIFLNVEELLENSQVLAERLRDAVEIALEQGDEDLLTVNVGKMFLESMAMLHAFETYCVRQGAASLLLASLEKEKELLRIFLRVSQMENTMLRRMNLNSFLMVPVQRVTKYPLLLARLYKVTPAHYDYKEELKEAQHKIELHLNHMNSQTKDVPSKLWRRIGSSNGRRASTEMDLVNIKLRKIAVDVLEWNHEEAKFALEGKLLFTQPTDNNWRKGRTIKLMPVNALLVINGKPTTTGTNNKPDDNNGLVFSKHGAREAALLLVRDKNGRYSLLREPLYLDRCVIAADPAWQSYFEVQELLGKDTFIFKAEDEEQTSIWYKQLQYHAQGMGAWRKRRNALANIMINGMGLRS